MNEYLLEKEEREAADKQILILKSKLEETEDLLRKEIKKANDAEASLEDMLEYND